MVTLEPAHLDLDIALPVQGSSAPPASATGDEVSLQPLKLAVESYQRQLIRHSLDLCEHNWAEVARRLELDPSNLHKLAKRLGLK